MTFIDEAKKGKEDEEEKGSDIVEEALAPRPVLSEYHEKKNLPEAASRFARDELFGRWKRREGDTR